MGSIDTKVGANYHKDKFTRMKAAWTSIIKKSMQLAQIELPKNISKFAKVHDFGTNTETLKKKKTKTRSI